MTTSAAPQLHQRAVHGSPLGDPLATPIEVAEHLHVTVKTLTQWRWRKTGPIWTKVGGRVRYAWPDVENWLAAQKTAALS